MDELAARVVWDIFYSLSEETMTKVIVWAQNLQAECHKAGQKLEFIGALEIIFQTVKFIHNGGTGGYI